MGAEGKWVATIKFLVVDDNSRWRRLMRGLFEVVGSVVECSDGDQALDAYRSEKPDWVLMDITMAVTDGFTAASRIRSHYRDAHILFVSQHNDPDTRATAAKLGCELVAKDNLESLHAKIHSGYFGRQN